MNLTLTIEQEFGEQFGGTWEYTVCLSLPKEYLYLKTFETQEKAEQAIQDVMQTEFDSLATFLHGFEYMGEFKSEYFFTPITTISRQ